MFMKLGPSLKPVTYSLSVGNEPRKGVLLNGYRGEEKSQGKAERRERGKKNWNRELEKEQGGEEENNS